MEEKMKCKRFSVLILAVFFVLSSALGCSAAPADANASPNALAGGPELPVVKVTINTWPGLGPYYVAKAKGFDKEEGIQLEVIMNENTESRRSSLLSGEVDLVGITLDSVILAQSRGVPMTVVGLSDMSYGGDGIIAKEEIKTIPDLKGKKIACAEGLPSHFFLLYLLEKHNLGPEDIKLVPADDGGQAAFLFTSGRVDAAVTWDPWISQVGKFTKGHVLVTTKDEPGIILGIIAANKNLLPKKADRIKRTINAWFKAVEYWRQYPDEANKIMAKEYNVPIEDFKRMISGAKLFDLKETLEIFGRDNKPGSIYRLAEEVSKVWLDAGIIKTPVNPKNVIDWTIIKTFFPE
jgi:NitT/TauT family transport system substrate-binding protein